MAKSKPGTKAAEGGAGAALVVSSAQSKQRAARARAEDLLDLIATRQARIVEDFYNLEGCGPLESEVTLARQTLLLSTHVAGAMILPWPNDVRPSRPSKSS